MPSLPRMKTVKILAVLATAFLLAACGPKTVIDGTLQDKADAPVVQTGTITYIFKLQ